MRSVIVEPLRKHPTFVPALARHLEREWPDWYGPSGPGNAARDLAAFANPEGVLPVGVVALSEAGEPCGVAALKGDGLPQFGRRSPWAAAGFVVPERRRQGIGAALLAALLGEAARLGYESVFCATSTAVTLLQREGWRLLQRSEHDGKPIFLFSSGSAD